MLLGVKDLGGYSFGRVLIAKRGLSLSGSLPL